MQQRLVTKQVCMQFETMPRSEIREIFTPLPDQSSHLLLASFFPSSRKIVLHLGHRVMFKRRGPSHGLPRSTDPVVRKKGTLRPRWKPCQPCVSDLDWLSDMLGESPEPQGLSVYRRFLEIRDSLPREPTPTRLALAIQHFAGQVGQVLGTGTLVTYLGHIKRYAREVGEPFTNEAAVVWTEIYRVVGRPA